MTESRLGEIREQTKRLLDETALLAESAGTQEFSMMVVTKNREPAAIQAAYAGGARLFGENRIQSFREKCPYFESLKGADVHIIGHLQTNKVKYVVGECAMIQSVDSYELAEKIGRRACSLGIKQEILLQVNTGYDDNKFGFLPEALQEALFQIAQLDGILIKGIMTIPPITSDLETEKVFERTRKLFVDMKGKKLDNVIMQFLSMGMSNDYKLAIKHGANMVRLGSVVFDL